MFDDSMVEYDITVFPDGAPIRGFAMFSGNEDTDREVEDKIIADFEGGNIWAWCVVKVTARYYGVDSVEGVVYLGECSYKDESDFKHGGYYEDMCYEAKHDLYSKLENILNCIN